MCASYHCSVEPPVKLTGHHERVSINLALGVLRCTGLKVICSWWDTIFFGGGGGGGGLTSIFLFMFEGGNLHC